MKKGLWLTLIVMACLVACKRGRTTADPTVGDTLRLKYAEKLTIVKHDGFTEVMLADPWNKGKMLCRYLLVERGKRPPEQI
jgi:iron complex transport system substrate-binding protein